MARAFSPDGRGVVSFRTPEGVFVRLDVPEDQVLTNWDVDRVKRHLGLKDGV